jgi:hypothetical protein
VTAADLLTIQTPAEMREALEALNEQGGRVLLALNAEMEAAEKSDDEPTGAAK